LACISEGRLLVFSGCAHSGICNMVEHARKVTGVKQVHAVIGGFHLKMVDWQTKRTIVYLKELQVKHIYPSHCTQDPALRRMVELFDGLVPTAGTQYVF